MRLIGSVVLLLVSVGCATTPQTSQDVARAVDVKDSQFDAAVRYTAPQVNAGGWNTQTRYRLRGWRDKKTNELSHQLYVNVWYNLGGWRHYETASFVGGKQVRVEKIDSKPSCTGGGGLVTCAYDEWIGVPLADGFLRETRATGFDVRLNARSGDELVINVPASYVGGYLDATVGR